MTEQMFLTVREAAAAAGVSPATIDRAIHAGLLRAKKSATRGGVRLVSREALRDWFEQLEDA